MSLSGANFNQHHHQYLSPNQTSNLLSSSSQNTTALTSTSISNSAQANQNPTRQLLNNSTVKLIQRLLDEASQTGDILLSNRNLNEFPSKLAINYDLSDTLTADLSKNHLTEFPKELTSFDYLEKLSLYSNLIRTVPDISVHQLKCLKFLDLNSNNLSYLPPCLCNLVSLEVLTVNNNKLVSLPEEIGRLDKLIQLDVSCNEITHLPVQIGDMTSLRALNVRRNLLVELPKEISQLKLVSFDCSSNRLSKLPLCFREMVTLIDLVVDHNPLEVPPAHICTKGLLHIMKYLLVEAIKEEKKRGILTEYEINSQYNNFNYNLSAHHQRLSCTAGLGSMFQSSVRNMGKKLDSCSTPSSSMSTVSSSSSTSSSSSVSSSSLNSQTPMPVYTSKQVKTSFIDLPPPHPPPPPPTHQSQQSSLNTTPTNQQYSNQIINLSNSFKLSTEMENVDYVDAPSTSSPSSTKSSSSSTSSVSSTGIPLPIKSTIKTHKIQETPNSKVVSIHELISLKSPNSGNSTCQLNQQQTNLNYLKFNRNLITDSLSTNTISKSNEFQVDQQIVEQQNLWRLNNSNNSEHVSIKTKHTGLGTGLLNPSSQSNKLVNINTQKRLNSTECVNSFDLHGNNIQKNLTTIDGTTYSSTNANTLKQTSKNLVDKRYQTSTGYHSTTSTTVNKRILSKSNSIEDINYPNYIADNQTNNVNNTTTNLIFSNQNSYLDTIGTELNNYVISVDNQELINDELSKYYKHQSSSNPSQQVWVPRDDLQSPTFYSQQQSNDLENVNPAFTIRRHFIQIQEEQKQIEVLKKTIESRLKIQLPSTMDELGANLSDGVVLCHLMNQIFPRAVQIIHVPSLAVPKLSLAKCRKNVENFIDACRRLGLPENDICCAHDIIEAKNTPKVARTVIMLIGYNQYLQQQQQHDTSNTSFNNTNNSNANRQTTIGSIMNHNSTNGLQLQQQQQQQQTAV